MEMVGSHSNMTMPFYVAAPIFEGVHKMKDSDKTKKQLIDELEARRWRAAEIGKLETECN